SLWELLEAAEGTHTGSLASEIPARDPDAPLPLSLAQQRLWFLDRLDQRAGAAYHIPTGVRLQGRLDVPALQAALDRIVARHEVLRTCFEPTADGAMQRIAARDRGLALQHHDLSALPAAEQQAQLRTLTNAEAAAPFDLAHGPLIRARLVRLADTDHVLLVTMHHIVSDGWSMGVLVREFGALYAAFAQGQADPLPPLPIQYADFAVWQRRWLEGPVLQRQLQFWTEHLQGAPALLELPTDRPRPPMQDFTGDSVGFELDAALTAQLKALAQRHGATLFMVLLAAWGALLARLSGQGEAVIGTPVANRNRAEIEPLIGFFVNTQALRVSLAGNPSTAELLARVQATALAAQDHQDLPFDQIIEALNPERSLTHPPVFQALFDWQNAPMGDLELPGLQLEGLHGSTQVTKFDIELVMQDRGERIAGALSYVTALFNRATIERHVALLQTLLQGMVADEQAAVARLPLLPAAETEWLHSCNATEADFPADLCIHQRFEQQVRRTPEAIALVFEDTTLSYAQLDAQANRLAHHLITLGVRPDTRVALCLPRGIDMVVALLATLKAGGAYVPLDPGYPPERLAFMLEDCRPRVLLTDAATRAALATLPVPPEAPVVLLDDPRPWSGLAASAPDAAALGLQPSHLAYVIYTSGSTGRPKGVMVAHSGLCNLAQAQAATLAVTADSRVLQFASVSFDACIFEVLMALLSGATLCLPGPGLVAGQALLDVLQRRRISHATLTPAVLLALPEPAPGQRPRLRTLVVAGEACSQALVQRFAPWTESLINAYGPTEATVWASMQSCDIGHAGPPPIGRPICNTRMHVLDAQGQPLPIGAAGEIHIAGAGLARGYLNRPDLTAERFVPDPFGPAGSRMYRTGDLGRWRIDANGEGSLEFLGRNDHQVKIRGFRIELGEIEAALLVCPGVREAVVLAREDEPGNKRLVAYLTGAGLQPEALRAALARSLPEHMVPAAYVLLEDLPLTPNGKLDRKALPTPEGAAFGAAQFEPPQGEIESTLAALWCELLGLKRVGRADNFFELGGYSLLAVTLIERMGSLGWQLPVRALFISPTLAELARAVDTEAAVEVPPNLIEPGSSHITPQMLPLVQLSQAEIDAVVRTVPGGAANVQDIYPLAPLQEGLLFHALLAQGGDAYVQSHLLAFDTRPRLDGFVHALQRVIARHDILRTAIVWQDLREPVQVVWRSAPLPLHESDPQWSDAPAALQAWVDGQRAGFDLRQAPLLRGAIAHDAADKRWLLQLAYHHMVGDHTTLDLLVQEVQAHLLGEQRRLPAAVPFRNFVAQARLGVSPQQHEDFFTGMLADVTEPTAPFGLLDVRGDGSDISEALMPLPAPLAASLRAHARRLGVSAAGLFHLAYALLLARTSARTDVVFGTVLFGRMHGGEGADRALGMFINTLPLRVRLDTRGVAQAVRDTHALLARLLQHEHASLALAQRCSGVPAPAPLFSALLNYR
ncbi:MAG TPA: amino acid adenylation domain-containing protein, partial [Burkholderiaceae bacterium]|nr:amino acid adenylation domain-containing protein [Burkholderiaceae bacterium]